MSIIYNRDKNIKIRTCRICLEANNVDIVSLEDQNGWLRLFEFCFGITLTTQDEPRLLCKTCAQKVQNYVAFKEKCQKSHNLWRSVISDVKCYVVKHRNIENANQYESNPIRRETQIKDEPRDELQDNDLDFSNDYETVPLSPDTAEIKKEKEDIVALKSEKYVKEPIEKDEFIKILVDLKQVNNTKIIKRNSSAKAKGKRNYTCVKCKVKVYGTKTTYRKHLKKCQIKTPKRHNRRIFDQEYAFNCGRKYDGQNISEEKSDNFINREIIEIQDDSIYPCGLCYLTFTSAKDVFVHLNDHWSNNDLACKLCDFIGVDLAATAVHRYFHLPHKGASPLCHICGKSKYSLMSLHFHYRRDHLNKPGGYCSRCNKEYTLLRYWKRHEFRNHLNTRFKCDICGKGFYYKHTIEEHMINHMKLNNPMCDICGNIFSRQRYLALHTETVHAKSGPFKCTHCNRFYKSEFTLSKHQKRVSREKTLQCEICQKFFITPNVLKLHMVMHSEERPYLCNFCNTSYKYKCHLSDHLLKHGFSSHKCLLCTKTFATSKALKRHSAVHTGLRGHSCSVTGCAKTFYSKKQMLAHLELRHKNEKLK